jgi:hypothetical protein
MIELCCICHEVLIPTSFDKHGLIIAVGIGCPDQHYAKVFGNGVMSEIVDGMWFSCHVTAPMKTKVGWQHLINRAVFKACRKYRVKIDRIE